MMDKDAQSLSAVKTCVFFRLMEKSDTEVFNISYGHYTDYLGWCDYSKTVPNKKDYVNRISYMIARCIHILDASPALFRQHCMDVLPFIETVIPEVVENIQLQPTETA